MQVVYGYICYTVLYKLLLVNELKTSVSFNLGYLADSIIGRTEAFAHVFQSERRC